MALQEGRFTASAEGRSKGVTLLVPRQVVEAEQRELMDYITSAKVQNLIVFLRRGGLRHLDVNETIRNGEHKGLNPLHVAINKTNASVVSALLELATGVSPDARSKAGDRPLHLACAVGDVGMVRALIEYKADANLTNNNATPLLVRRRTQRTRPTTSARPSSSRMAARSSAAIRTATRRFTSRATARRPCRLRTRYSRPPRIMRRASSTRRLRH